MILNKKDIKKVIGEVKQALLVGADKALSKEGVVAKPEDINYKCGDIGLPLIFYDPSDNLATYDTQSLYETLRQIERGELPNYLHRAGIVADDKNVVNVGAILKEKALKKSLLENKHKKVIKIPPGLKKGKRK